MRYIIQAACGCDTGKIRRQNEDNFYFDGKCLEKIHRGLRNPAQMEQTLKNGLMYAVFDGMGGENFGEEASYASARQMQRAQRSLEVFFIPERKYLERLVRQMDDAVSAVQKELHTEKMGSTMVGLYFQGRYVYVCNVGDSRAYRLREGEFLQLSCDHVDGALGHGRHKAPLTQYLGYGDEDVQLEPHIAKGEIQPGDLYLLCSDGLTDMLTNFEITDIMLRHAEPESCVQALIDAANAHGGRDNITAIVCKLIEKA